jgi:serine/threonine-protein kinase
VVNIHSYGYFESDRPYLALEYLEGTSLTRAIEPNSPMQAGQALPVIKQIAIALSAAHANGIYHRDVKPSNVIVVGRSSSLKIKLIDFGVARHEYVSYVTMDGTLMGTPPYISPEQGKGGDIDSRSDIYSLGVLAYALLGGSPPFTDQNPLNVLKMHQEASVPPLPDRVPTPVAKLVYWMLEKNPEDRPSKTWQVVGRIDELIADHG